MEKKLLLELTLIVFILITFSTIEEVMSYVKSRKFA